MKLVSFLGTTDYKETTYLFADEQEQRSRFFPVAAAHAYMPDSLHLLVTRGAYDVHYETVRDELEGVTAVEAVLIPDGRSEQEIWQIFEELTEQFDPGDEIIFDITLSYRSLPVLAIIAADYLQVAKKVTIKGMIYGAFEAQDGRGRAPVFDLTPFLTLMDWTLATDKFVKTGNAAELGQKLQDAHALPYQRGVEPAQDLPRQLQYAARSLEDVSQAMRLVRPHEAQKAAWKLEKDLRAAEGEFGQWAKPFAVLLQQTQAEYAPFAVAEPENNADDDLQAQLALIQWYVSKGQVVQAITLAREWLVSLLTFMLGWDLIKDRGTVENLLNAVAYEQRRQAEQAGEIYLPPPLRALQQALDIATLWNKLSQLRNDVAHCGMRRNPLPASRILKQIRSLLQDLEALGDQVLL